MSSAYDPDAPEGSKPRGSGYVSKRDIIIVLTVLPIIAVALTPLYLKMREDGERKICSTNIQAVAKAIQSYVALNDDRFPPIYEEGDNGSPSLIAGVPLNWMSLVESGMSKRAQTTCPSSKPEENSRYFSPELKGPRQLSYGMYFPVSAVPLYQLSQPGKLIMLTETITGGASGSYNPVPFTYSDGSTLKDDGFMIGFDNKPDGNFEWSTSTKAVTRLAFPGTADGDFRKPGLEGRHHGENHVVYADGSGGTLTPGEAPVKLLGEDLTGTWRTK